MNQALHILKKDVRYLRYEIILVLLTVLAFAAMHARPSRAANDAWWAEVAFAGTAVFLIGRLVLAEAIPGDRQFWITRPYRWPSLLAAKTVFILTFVNLPLFFADLFILIVDRFPLAAALAGLLWTQVLLFTFGALPFAALAALSSGMAAFVFAQLIVFAAGFGIWEFFNPQTTARLSALSWVCDAAGLILLAAIAIAVLFLQYGWRRTPFARLFAVGGIAVGTLAFLLLPWRLALGLQSHLSEQPSMGSSIKIGVGDQPGNRSWAMQMHPRVALHLPVAVEDIPQGAEIEPDALTLTVLGANGDRASLGATDCSGLARETVSSDRAIIAATCFLDPEFYRRYHNRPLTLRGTLYFSLFGKAHSRTIPITEYPANIGDGLQCYTNAGTAEWDVYCRAAFRWPSRLVYAKLGSNDANAFTQLISYSPFPAAPNIEPVETRWASAYTSGPPTTVREVTIITKEPLAHLRRDFEKGNVRLDELVVPRFFYPKSVYPTAPAIH